MRNRWKALDRDTKIVLTVAVTFVVVRTLIASLSGFGFHQGWNEGHYALIASGFLEHPLVPRYGENLVYSVPPLFPYTILAAFMLFGESVLAARLPSILVTGGLIFCTYELGREIFEESSTAALGAVILAMLPYVQLYGGRAQTDIMMVFFITASITAILKGYRRKDAYRHWLIAGAALFAAAVATKQPALGVAGVVFFWLLGNLDYRRQTLRRTALLIVASVICLVPLFIWLYLNYRLSPGAFVADWERELFGRTEAFANIRLLVVIALGVGMTPLVLASSSVGVVADLRDTVERYRARRSNEPGLSVLVWWLVLFGLFVFARSPQGHQYYAVVLAPPFALLAADGLQTVASRAAGFRGYEQRRIYFFLIVVLLLSTLGSTIVLFELSGEFSAANGSGEQIGAEAGESVAGLVEKDDQVLVSSGYRPIVQWYAREDLDVDQVSSYYAGELTDTRLREVDNSTSGAVYVVAPNPYWEENIPSSLAPVYTTQGYKFTTMTVVPDAPLAGSKLAFYTTTRRLTVYRYRPPVDSTESIQPVSAV